MNENQILDLCAIIREMSLAAHRFLRHGHSEKIYENSLANRLQNSQDGYWLANARVAVAADDGAWEAALFARNIFNKLYVSQSYDNWGGIFPSQNFLGDPVTYGASITIRY